MPFPDFTMSIIICNEDSENQIEQSISLMSKFIAEYSWLTDAYILEFFTDAHWQKLPLTWQTYYSEIDLKKLSLWLETGRIFGNVMPLSLMAFKKCTQVLALQRKPITGPSALFEYLGNQLKAEDFKFHMHPAENAEWLSAQREFHNPGRQSNSLDHIFRRHVKPKKQHEIYRIAEITSLVSKMLGNTRVVDIGSGQGHLSRLLCFQYNFKVLTMEAEGTHTSHAEKFDNQAMKRMKKIGKTQECICPGIKAPIHIHLTLTPETSEIKFTQMVTDGFCSLSSKNMPSPKDFTVIGLHTCGNLASTIIKLFKNCGDCSMLISLPCCYMKMFDQDSQCTGYPLSKFVSSLNLSLSFEAMEMACHALEIYFSRLKVEHEKLKIHCYRAILEVLIRRNNPEMKRLGLRSVKYKENLTFKEYATKALSQRNIRLPNDPPDSIIQDYMGKWKRVVVLYSIRLMLAPVVESIILLDRLVFLYEQGIMGCIAPIFDPVLSPRNLAIIAVKSRR